MKIRKRLNQILLLGGKYVFAPEVKEFYGDWYRKHYNTAPPDQRLTGYWHRKATHLIKLSMLAAVAEHNDPELKLGDIQTALAILDLSEPAFLKAVKGIGKNELNSLTLDILEQIRTAPGGKMPKSTILEMNLHRMGDQDFTEIIKVLIEMKKIEPIVQDGEYFFKPIGSSTIEKEKE
jgi:hypothetical protein